MEKLKDPIEVEHVGLPKEKWMRYQRSLRALGIVQILKGEGGVSFKVDQNSISNGDSDKGYEYDLAPPEHQKTSLDAYRISANDRD